MKMHEGVDILFQHVDLLVPWGGEPLINVLCPFLSFFFFFFFMFFLSLFSVLYQSCADAINGKGQKVRLLNILMQLRKVCNHPYLFDGAEPGPPFEEGEHLIENCGKLMVLNKLLIRLQERGSRVLIFSQMTRMLDILEDYMHYSGYRYCRIDGSTNQADRDSRMEDFQAPGSDKFCFLLSTRAGGLGINLQSADVVILYDSDWNPQMDLQAQDRAHRIGQKKQVQVYRFVTADSVEEKIVERATKKLFLDAMVIEQGRLKQQNLNCSPEELQSLIRFGASRIFESKESTVTDADIDAILAQGKERTEKENENMKSAQMDLLTFKMDTEETSYYANPTKPEDLIPFGFIEPPKRERKVNYDSNQYYRQQVGGPDAPPPVRPKKEFKASQRLDFQFFNTARLWELEEKDFKGEMQLKILMDEWRYAKKVERRQRIDREREAKRAAWLEKRLLARDERMRNGDNSVVDDEEQPPQEEEKEEEDNEDKDEDEDNKEEDTNEDSKENDADGTKIPTSSTTENKKGRASSKSHSKKETSKEEEESRAADMARLRMEANCLTEKEAKEKAELEAEGFNTMQRKHFQAYIRACEAHGRENIDTIKTDVADLEPDVVVAYHKVYWKRYQELKDWEKQIAQIEKGEAKLAKLAETVAMLKEKVARHKMPYVNLTVPYPAAGGPQKLWTLEEDRFIIMCMHVLGPNNWQAAQKAIRSAWQFRFDWFMKSRSPLELSRRGDYLLKILAKEAEELAEKEKKAKLLKKQKEKAALAKKEAEEAAAAKKKASTKKASVTKVSTKKDGKSSVKAIPSKKEATPSKKAALEKKGSAKSKVSEKKGSTSSSSKKPASTSVSWFEALLGFFSSFCICFCFYWRFCCWCL